MYLIFKQESSIAAEEDFLLTRHKLTRNKIRDAAMNPSADTTTIKRVSNVNNIEIP